MGVNIALARCAAIYDPSLRVFRPQRRSGDSLSRVDWAVFEDDMDHVILEAESPTVMKAVGERLPLNGAHLRWQQGENLLSKVLLKVISFPRILYDAKT
jgi:hypothetical protein